ncbi:MAG: tyrosine-type recombinase/integrase [Myxococcota bacterium]
MLRGVEEQPLFECYRDFMRANDASHKERTKDFYEELWDRIEPELGHLLVQQIKTERLDDFLGSLPDHLSGSRKNKHMGFVRTLLRFSWRRGRLDSVPYVPLVRTTKTQKDWYSKKERDLLLDAIFRDSPEWYCFFYLSMRLGLRRGEVYGITLDQLREDPPMLLVDRQIQQGKKDRPAMENRRKSNEAYSMGLPLDVVDAIQWHIERGYSGDQYLFSKDGAFPKYLDSHRKPLKRAQEATGLRQLSHHCLGRHSVASQAASSGESLRVIQAQLGQRSIQSTEVYAKVANHSQLRLVEGLAPDHPPHVNVVSTESGQARESSRRHG